MRTSPVWKRALINSSPGERPVPALSPLCISNHQKSPHGIYLSLPQNAMCHLQICLLPHSSLPVYIPCFVPLVNKADGLSYFH